MAPSVIYIDEAEKVFISDKKKLKEFGSQPDEACALPYIAYKSRGSLIASAKSCSGSKQLGPGQQEPTNRIRKELLKECKQLGPGQRVLIIGNSREPYLATRKVGVIIP
eukprot:scaffold76000_cov20-Tisochrysis_lutea.AAC.1